MVGKRARPGIQKSRPKAIPMACRVRCVVHAPQKARYSQYIVAPAAQRVRTRSRSSSLVCPAFVDLGEAAAAGGFFGRHPCFSTMVAKQRKFLPLIGVPVFIHHLRKGLSPRESLAASLRLVMDFLAGWI